MKAEALRWENRRLADANKQLERLTMDQQRRLLQLEELLAEAKEGWGPPTSPAQGRAALGNSIPKSGSGNTRAMDDGLPPVASMQAGRQSVPTHATTIVACIFSVPRPNQYLPFT